MPRTRMRAILIGGLVAGSLDITYAIVFSALRGTPPMRLLQSVATGLLGNAAYDGGAATAALGFVLHFALMLVIASSFYVLSRRILLMRQRPILAGAVFGIGVYLVMTFVVLPLSAFPHPFRPIPFVIAANILVHMFLIGVPIALAARDPTLPRPDT